jgi:hypothetical protein
MLAGSFIVLEAAPILSPSKSGPPLRFLGEAVTNLLQADDGVEKRVAILLERATEPSFTGFKQYTR